MTYSEWKEAFVEDAIPTQTRKEFAKYSEILGNNPMTIGDFVKIKYNDEKWKKSKI